MMTREEAIKIIEVAKAEVEWEAPLDYQIAFDLAMEALKQPTQQWIPVSGRLPEEEVNVLVTRKYGTKRYVETAELLCGEWLCDMDEYKINPKVHSKPIAWMPLPEPFKVVVKIVDKEDV